jgi:hypothetical protein
MKTSIYKSKPRFIGEDIPLKTFTANNLPQLRYMIAFYMIEHNLNMGNWGTAKVFKDDNPLGYMSYNGRIWDRDCWLPKAKVVEDL